MLCKIFGHKWRYFITGCVLRRNFRSCKRCGIMQEHKELSVFGWCWVTLVERSTKGAKEWLKSIERIR